MKIGDLATRSRVNASAIRYYEKLGVLPPPGRIHSQRRYSSDDLDRVLLIRFAGEMDFTLAEIKLFLHGFRQNTPVSARWRKLTAAKIAELQAHLLQTQRLLNFLKRLQLCRCIGLHQCISALSLSPRRRAASLAPKSQKRLRRSAALLRHR